MAKTPQSFGCSECNWVKFLQCTKHKSAVSLHECYVHCQSWLRELQERKVYMHLVCEFWVRFCWLSSCGIIFCDSASLDTLCLLKFALINLNEWIMWNVLASRYEWRVMTQSQGIDWKIDYSNHTEYFNTKSATNENSWICKQYRSRWGGS